MSARQRLGEACVLGSPVPPWPLRAGDHDRAVAERREVLDHSEVPLHAAAAHWWKVGCEEKDSRHAVRADLPAVPTWPARERAVDVVAVTRKFGGDADAAADRTGSIYASNRRQPAFYGQQAYADDAKRMHRCGLVSPTRLRKLRIRSHRVKLPWVERVRGRGRSGVDAAPAPQAPNALPALATHRRERTLQRR